MKTAVFFRRLSSLTLEKPPAQLIVRTWQPSVKMKKNGAVIRMPVTTAEIKMGLPSFEGDPSSIISVEPYGHASVSLFVDLKRIGFQKKFIDLLQVSMGIDMHAMSTLEAYMSLYPAYDPEKQTYIVGRERTSAESEKYGQLSDYLQKAQEALPEGSKELTGSKGELFDDEGLLGKPWRAINGQLFTDMKKYREPVETTFDRMDFESVIISYMQVMKAQSRAGRILMHEVRDDGLYYGLDIIRVFQELISHEHGRVYDLPKAEHVCTTGVLRILQAGFGVELYMKAAREVTAEYPDLAHGFPNVEFVRAVSSKLKLSLADKEEASIVSAPKPV